MSIYVKVGGGGSTPKQIIEQSYNPTNTDWKIYEQEFLNVASNRFYGSLTVHGAATAGSSVLSRTTGAGEENRLGIARYTSSSTVGGYVAGYTHNLSTLFGSGDHRVTTNMKHVTLVDATNDFIFCAGFSNDTNSIGTHMSCIGIDRSINATNYIAFAINGTRTNVDTGIPLDTDWHTFDVIINADNTEHTYYIDGALVATITTNLPVAALGMMLFQQNVAGAARQFDVDVLTYGFKPAVSRGTSAPWL